MPSYEVVKPCYIPFNGRLRYRTPGRVVTLDVEEAEKLEGYVRPASNEVTVRNPDIPAIPDTPEIVRNPDSVPTAWELDTSTSEILDGEVSQDAGEQGSADERAGAEIT